MRSYSSGCEPVLCDQRRDRSHSSRGEPVGKRFDDRLQHDASIGAADAVFTRPLGVRHQPDDVARGVADAGDVVDAIRWDSPRL